jgi:fatty acid desaturase
MFVEEIPMSVASDLIAPTRGSAYALLSRTIKDAGLLERRRGYYVALIATIATLCIGAVVAFALIGDSWWQLAVAALAAVLLTQLGFLGHDAGHRQVFTSHRANYVLGVLCANVAVGLSYGWWVDKHVRHHAHPNDDGKDPDVEAGAFVFTHRQAGVSTGFARFMYRYQAYAFFPLLLLEGINLRVASVRYLMNAGNKHRLRESLLLGLHIVGYLAAVFIVLSPVKAAVFIAVHQGLFGLYLGCSFAPNHKGMPPLSADDDADFLRRQVLTSRNVYGGLVNDVVFGGLNYQIEHHLFPSMPRANLKRAQLYVREFCHEHRVSYLETGAIASYAQALRHLNAVGRSVAAPTAA